MGRGRAEHAKCTENIREHDVFTLCRDPGRGSHAKQVMWQSASILDIGASLH